MFAWSMGAANETGKLCSVNCMNVCTNAQPAGHTGSSRNRQQGPRRQQLTLRMCAPRNAKRKNVRENGSLKLTVMAVRARQTTPIFRPTQNSGARPWAPYHSDTFAGAAIADIALPRLYLIF